MIRAWLLRDELQDEIFNMLDAIGKGVSFTEIMWDTSEGEWQPNRLEWRDPRWFRFDRVDGSSPLLRTDTLDVPLPPMKFICAVIRAKSGLPVRSGIARLAAWSWMFKAYTLRDWAIFVQTFGQPIRVGKYPAGATEADKETLFRAVANIAGDCAAIIPESMMIEFVRIEGVTAHGDLYEKRVAHLDQQMSKAILGQTATTDAIAGGHAVGQEHRQVQEDIERADAKSLSAILNRDLVRVWIDLEYGPQKAYPKLKIGRADQRDVKLTVDSIGTLMPFGLRVEKSWANDMLGIPDPDPDAELLTAPAPARNPFADLLPGEAEPGTRPALHATSLPARRATDEVDRLATAAEDVVQPAADALIDRVRAVVNEARSLEELRDKLRALEGDMPTERLAELMRLALVMANLGGRADIANG
jgi:phage gp29-like protein